MTTENIASYYCLFQATGHDDLVYDLLLMANFIIDIRGHYANDHGYVWQALDGKADREHGAWSRGKTLSQ